MSHVKRREFLHALAAAGMYAAGARAQVNPKPRFAADPFSLGVASGYPLPAGMVLWTRLAPAPDADGGGMGRDIVPVRWEIATDDAMREVVASGSAEAAPEWGHSVHVEPQGLASGRPYWYRFSAGAAQSPIGAHPHRARRWTPRRRGCASPSPPASSTSRATTAPTSTSSPTSPTSSSSSATTSTSRPGGAITCASTPAASPTRSRTIARATRCTSPIPTCRRRTAPARGS